MQKLYATFFQELPVEGVTDLRQTRPKAWERTSEG
jgi:hypothetical protein